MRKLEKFGTWGRSFLLLSILCFVAICAQAQKVSGVVKDQSGEPVIGATVKVVGTNTGAVTDAKGHYEISASNGSILSFSYVGYLTKQMRLRGENVVDITLQEDNTTLNDLVVVGYGTMKKSDISGSVSTINKEQMERKVPTNIAQALQGAAAGVMVTSQDGAPGSKSAIRIRGVGTINGDAQPLYVVDGVQVGNNADFVNPSDIENIEILKDASATAIYGSKGANGVIMITTKHGNKGSMVVNATADFGFQTLPYKIETLSGDEYARSIREARANDGAASPTNMVFLEQYDGQRNNIDWQDQMTRTGIKQQYGLSASGGTDKTQYNFSLGYLDNNGIIVNSNYNRLTARASVKSKINNYIEFGGDVNYMYSTIKGNNIGLGNNTNLSSQRDLAQMAPTLDYVEGNVAGGKLINVNVVNPDGSYGTTVVAAQNGWDGMNETGQNPYATQKEIGRKSVNSRVSITPYLDITLLNKKQHSLNVHTILSWTQENSNADEFSGKFERYNYLNGVKTPMEYKGRDAGEYSFNLNQSYGLTKGIETYMTYKWQTDFNTLTLMAGNSVSEYEGRWVSASTNKFLSNEHRKIGISEGEKNGDGGYNPDVKTISYYGRLIYNLFDRYILTGTLRRDGSSNFSESNKWGTFPSAALAWRIKEESFLKNVDQISNAKIRLGWGQTGNAGQDPNKSRYILSTTNTKYQFYGTNGGGSTGSFERVTGSYFPLVDTGLKWETNEQTNFGLDLGFLNNNLSVTVDYFVRKTKDLLLYKQIRPSSGYTEVYTNYGEIDNYGLEFSVNYNKQLNQDWNINVAFNGSTLKNEIKKMGVDYTSTCSGGNSTYSASDSFDGSNVGAVDENGFKWTGHSICREGEAVGSYYGWKVDHIYTTQEEIDADDAAAKEKGSTSGRQGGKTKVGDYRFQDLNGDGVIDDSDRTILGNGLPSFNYGLNISATYKNFDMSIYTYGVLGMDILSYSAMRYAIINPSDDCSTPALLKDSYAKIWSPSNTGGTLPRLTRNDDNKNSRVSDAWIENGNFFKISNIQIGYNVPKEMLKTIGISSARVYFAVQNLCTISPYTKYGDPEVGAGSVLYSGLDTGRYATPRTYQFGLNVTF